jgi:hydroxyacylglutathione hydrolase
VRLRQIPCGGDRNFGYLLLAGGEAALVDPGEDPAGLEAALDESGARLRWLIGTHGHADHLQSLDEVQGRRGGERVLSEHLAQPAELRLAGARLSLPLGGETLQLLATPGHTPCSLCVLAPGEDGHGELLSGDLLFVGKIGGTAGEEAARLEYASLHGILLALPDETRVWPGHDYGTRPHSTIGAERRENPFLLQPDFAAFLHLKATWAEYKLRHGIR